jgi:ADP-ribosyl-[dinitrogen reductase] hydrolase
MALCLASSLTELGGFDPTDQMQRYCKWKDEGYLSSNGRCFDIGNTVRSALSRFKESGEPFSGPTDRYSAGNGCIMRLAAVPMFFYPDRQAAIEMSGESARTTHGATECVEASRLFGAILFQALAGRDKDAILFDHRLMEFRSEGIKSIALGQYRSKSEDEVRGSGYVTTSLEAALWCFLQTTNFRDAILKAVNLGEDADTTAAVCGQVAGAFYGESGIPHKWLDRLVKSEDIRRLADHLYQHRPETQRYDLES